MIRARRTATLAARYLATVLAAAGVLLSGCGSGGGGAAPSTGRLPVVAAENFYGDLVAQVGGDKVAVTSVLSNPDADPHLFEPGTQNALAVANARVVVRNGDGYDDWMTKLLDAAPSPGRRLVTVADVVPQPGPDPNPHLWYDTPALPQIVTTIGDTLAAADPANAGPYRAGVQRTIDGLAPLQAAVRRLRVAHFGAAVAYTERVPGLLLAAAGLQVLTPPGFARAVENGTDPTPADVAALQRLLTEHRVRVLLYNEQATSPLTVRLRQVAAGAGVPVVAVTETEPAGTGFTSWQLGQVDALDRALSQ